MHYLLFYEKVSDYAERQGPFQQAHRAYIEEVVRRGKILLAGNLGTPEEALALLLFQSDSAEEVEDFAKGDPYVVEGVISRWQVRKWDTVLGPGAASPLPV